MNKTGKVQLVGVMITLVLLGALLPTIRSLAATVAENGTAAEIALYGIISVLIAVGVVVGLVKSFGLSGSA